MEALVDPLRVLHVVTAVLMAWPFYALVAVNQRARLGPPLGDRADTLIENIVKNRVVPCFVFQGTALVTGAGLMMTSGLGWSSLVTTPALGLKFLLLVLMGVLLSYVSLRIQPEIDALFARGGGMPSGDVATRIGVLRLRRKRLAALCFSGVLTATVLGVQLWSAMSTWIIVALVAAVGVFAWRAYSSTTPYGWF